MKYCAHQKRYLIVVLSVLAFIIFKSDFIPDNTHPVQRTVVITNTEMFQNIQFVGYISALVGEDTFYKIEQNQSLHKGYKFNRLYMFGIKQKTLQKLGGIDQLTEDYVFEKINPGEILSSATLYVDNSSLLESEEIFYEIEKMNADVYIAKMKRRITHFSDQTSETIEY